MNAHKKDAAAKSKVGRTPGKFLGTRAGKTGMSYKFQRLREKLRAAVASGELSGKLPGERLLARRFHVNAKTLSKALTDLAAEGVLDRSIGRGTFVKGSAPAAPTVGRWLVLADEGGAESALAKALRADSPELQVCTSLVEMRPSFLNQFAAVIDAASHTPQAFLRALVVRNMPVVAVHREPRMYSTHTVLLDTALCVSRLGRDLLVAGHRRLAVVEAPGAALIAPTLRQTVARFAPDATVEVCAPPGVGSDAAVTAFVCASPAVATQIRTNLEKAGLRVPSQVSVAAVGCVADKAPCSGYFCTDAELAEAVVGLLRDAPGSRPVTLWLAGAWQDLGTTAPTAAVPVEEAARLRIGGLVV